MEGVTLAGATGWKPAVGCRDNMRKANARAPICRTPTWSSSTADLSGANLKGSNMRKSDLGNADLSDCDMSGANLRNSDLTAVALSGARLCGAFMEDARGGRAVTVQVRAKNLEVRTPVVQELTVVGSLRLRSVAVRARDPKYSDIPMRMEVLTGPTEKGPFTSVLTFISAKTEDHQTFAAAPDAPALAGFVQVIVHDRIAQRAASLLYAEGAARAAGVIVQCELQV
jgi:hypothetical protein